MWSIHSDITPFSTTTALVVTGRIVDGADRAPNTGRAHVLVMKIRRRIVRVARHTGRDLALKRPTPVVGALLVGAVLGLGVTGAVVAVSGPDEARGDRGVITQQFDPGAGQEDAGHGPG